jgi:hypothetical protein
VELKPRLGQESLSCPLDELPLQARRFLDEATQ